MNYRPTVEDKIVSEIGVSGARSVIRWLESQYPLPVPDPAAAADPVTQTKLCYWAAGKNLAIALDAAIERSEKRAEKKHG